MKKLTFLLCILAFFLTSELKSQHSVARQWNEKILEAIRFDFARPTVHARNLFHVSAAMYDAWAVFEPTADTYFLGKTVQGFTIPYSESVMPEDLRSTQEEAMSFAAFRLINHRFRDAPLYIVIEHETEQLMSELGYDISNTSTSYHCGPAELGNYIAEQIILYGQQDGSNDQDDYKNLHYQPVNPPLQINNSGNPNILDFDRWQPLEFPTFVSQSGFSTGGGLPDFLGAEWGSVSPFSLKDSNAIIYERDGYDYKVYHDPGAPTYMDQGNETDLDNLYKWGHTLVAVWSSHLNIADSTLWDISPASKGNINSYPSTTSEYSNFYNLIEGGDTGTGYNQNPHTGLPYDSNLVKRSDYTRVLAEFWADGPDSETPPGHWFTILNEVNDNPDLEKKMEGTGEVLSDLEWDIKSYFILGGAMHDAAIAAWGIKGWYDYIRPISAIRGMADYGQGSDPNLPSYHKLGLPLIPNFVELIDSSDYLAGSDGSSIGDIKIYAWRGPNYIYHPMSLGLSSVGWIRAKDWWPYQRASFVTPPFAGYVSGHSTFSRAAAEVLTLLTGDAFFPGGMGEFLCPEGSLEFEIGPTEDIILQWATYRDASDQSSLSRIWGGIHPPIDDIPGRLIGEKVGIDAFNYAITYFSKIPEIPIVRQAKAFPNPTNCGINLQNEQDGTFSFQIFNTDGKLVMQSNISFENNHAFLNLGSLNDGIYIVTVHDKEGEIIFSNKVIKEE